MTLEQLTALVNAGFTKAEILAMAKPVEEPKPEEKPPEEPKKEEPAKPEFMSDKTFEETKKLFDSIGMKLDTLTAAVQKSNMNSGAATVTETVDSILASIINPPTKEGN